MTPVILLAVIGGLPVLLALVFRVNAIMLFLSVAAGNLLVTHVADDASLALGMVVRGQNVTMFTEFGLLLLPVALTILFLRKSMPRTKLVLHTLPLIATGLAIAVLALPFLDSNMQQEIFATPYGNILKNAQDDIVAAAAILTLILAWLTARSKEDKKKRH